MSENFIDRLAKINTLDPKDLFEGFYSLFSEIQEMKVKELIASKQAIDLGLLMSKNAPTEEQLIVLIDTIKAMQLRAYESICQGNCNSGTRWFLEILFYINFRKGSMSYFYYDQTSKKIVENKPNPVPSEKPQKRSWFSFSNKPRVHDPLNV